MTPALVALNSRTFSSLRKHRNYRLFFSGQIVSVTGTWMQDTALPWLILALTHSPVYVGLLVFARYAPFMLFGLHSGVLADRFLVLYGDSWLQVDPAATHAAAEASGLPALMTVYENNGQFDTSNVEYADGRVIRYEKGLDPVPPAMRWIDYGLSVFTREVIEERVPAGTVSDLATLCTALAAEGALAGLLVPDRFYEIGSPEGLAEVSALLAHRGP